MRLNLHQSAYSASALTGLYKRGNLAMLDGVKEVKLTGREQAVIRAIESQGSLGTELMERTHLEAEELADVLNGLGEVGYVEAFTAAGSPIFKSVSPTEMLELRFETNPSYAQQLRQAMIRR